MRRTRSALHILLLIVLSVLSSSVDFPPRDVSTFAAGAEVRVLSAVGMRQVLIDLGPKFERATGHRLKVSFDSGGVILKRLEGGETIDVAIIPRPGIERLNRAGRVVSGSVTDLATSGVGVAVRRGTPRPDISSPETFRRVMLGAKTIACPDPALGGSSGVHIARVFERLGIAEAVKPKLVFVSTPGQATTMPGHLVADGKAEIALHQMQELMAVPGIEVVGPLPGNLQETFVFSAAIMTDANDVKAAKALVGFLRTPEARAVIRAKGMEPAVSGGSSRAEKAGQVSANGVSLAYVEEGSGPPVVLIHGSVSDYREWSEQVAPLARHYRVIAYSRRYHWPNPPPEKDADASLERQADDLAAIIKATNIAPAHIVGHSYGGAVAINLTLRHPELVRTLVLAEPAVSGVLVGTPENDPVSKESQAVRAGMKEAFASGDAERIVRTYAARVAPGGYDKAGPEVRRMLLENVPAFQLDFNSRRTPFTCDDARRIAVPVLILSGERSPMGLQRIAQAAARCIKTARLVRIPQATHWMQHDQARVFNNAVLAFLAESGR